MSDPVTAALVTISIAGITLVCMLHALSSTLLREVGLIDLMRETARLQAEHERWLAEMKRGGFESETPVEHSKAA